MRWILPLVALAACAPVVPHEPIVKTVFVNVPVTVPCKATLPPLPVIPDETVAPDIFEGVKALKASKILLAADSAAVRSILASCIAGSK